MRRGHAFYRNLVSLWGSLRPKQKGMRSTRLEPPARERKQSLLGEPDSSLAGSMEQCVWTAGERRRGAVWCELRDNTGPHGRITASDVRMFEGLSAGIAEAYQRRDEADDQGCRICNDWAVLRSYATSTSASAVQPTPSTLRHSELPSPDCDYAALRIGICLTLTGLPLLERLHPRERFARQVK